MKPFLLFLTGLLWLAACSPLPRSSATKSVNPLQPGATLFSLAPTSLASTEELPAAGAQASTEGQKPAAGLVTFAGEPPADNQVSSTGGASDANTAVAPSTAGSDALLQEVSGLVAQRLADLVPAAPGWLHLITRQVLAKGDPQTNGETPQGEIDLEEWLSLDSRGVVRTEISRKLNEQGLPIEDTFMSHGAWADLSGDTSASQPYDPNYGVYPLLASLVQQGGTLNKGTLYRDCWYQGEKYTISDGKTTHEVLFRPDHHALRWIKTWLVDSGSVTLVSSLEIALEERLPQPPPDVLALAAKAGTP